MLICYVVCRRVADGPPLVQRLSDRPAVRSKVCNPKKKTAWNVLHVFPFIRLSLQKSRIKVSRRVLKGSC